MSQWKYTDNTNHVVFCTNPDGSMESCLASVLPEGTDILPAEPELAQEPVQELVTDPLEKLKAFLQANPDVQAILGA